MKLRPAGLAALVVLLLAGRTGAHSQPYSWIDLVVGPDSLRGEVTAHVVDLAHEIALADPDELLDPLARRTHEAALRAALARRLDLRGDGERLRASLGELEPVVGKQALRARFSMARPQAAQLEIRGPLFDWEATHETYVNLRANGRLEVQDLLDRTHRTARWNTGMRRDAWRVAVRFVREGVHHIFIGPDHILFIVGLLLLGGSLGRLTRIVTSFTLAHSITLAVATLGWLQPPARVIEPLIALSIVVVGIENLQAEGGGRDLRAALAFGFGLVHGFGFASVLRELSLPADALGAALLSFNVGVEAGQMAIVLTVAPLLALLRARQPAWTPWVLRVGSFGVIAAGAYWFVERVLGR